MYTGDTDPPSVARFDATLDAWVLSRYADVTAALREPALVMPGTASRRDLAHAALRESMVNDLAPERLASWRDAIEADAVRRVDALPVGETVDLVRSFAEPWSLELALLVTGAPRSDASECARLARELFVAAAVATDGEPNAATSDAALDLSRRLASATRLGDASATVQAFVALSQTLPSLLAGAWLALLNDAGLQSALRTGLQDNLQLPSRVVGELLRAHGPAQAVFREALADVTIGDAPLHSGERVVLMLGSANHDPERFRNPSRVDQTRESTAHVALGAGPHACAGASLVRMALDVATSALLRGTSWIQLDVTVPTEWIGGFAIRAPSSLPAVVSRAHDQESHNRENPE